MTTLVWIGLGSNLGDREATLRAAVAALADSPGVAVEAVSSCHETRPAGGPPGQGAFLNAAARLSTTLGPHQLLAVTRGIEDRFGRIRTVRWGERTLDIDLLIYGCKFLDTPDLKLPHPRLGLRRFVLGPLAEIAPSIVNITSKRTIAELLANLDRKPRLLALEGPPGSLKSAVFRRLLAELPAAGIEGEAEGSNADLVESAAVRCPLHNQAFARKVRALDRGHWASVGSQTPWIVADYFLDPGLIRASANEPPEMFADGPPDEWASHAVADHEWKELNRWAVEHALVPIFVVILPGPSGSGRRPGTWTVPSLRPEAETHDAIVGEVIWTCRSIQGT